MIYNNGQYIGMNISAIDENDCVEDIVTAFWLCSACNRMNEFNFLAAYRGLRGQIECKLAEHGLLDFESFRESQESYIDFSYLENFTIQTDYVYFGFEDVKEAVLKAQYGKMKETFEDYPEFLDLREILEDIDNICGATIEQKIQLFDRIIHAEHVTGMIFEDVEMDDLHNNVDDEIKEFLGIE